MIERFAAHDRGLHEDFELRLDLLLADVVREPLRADGAIDGLFFGGTGGLDDALGNHVFRSGHCGRTVPCSARRIRSSVELATAGERLEHLRDLGGFVAERHQRAPGLAFDLVLAVRHRRAGGHGGADRVETIAHLD